MKQQNKAFLREALRLTLPISMQFLVASAVNLADVIMLGRLGDEQVAAAGAANQIFFLLNLISFGIFSGASVFLAQFWGAKDVRNTRRTIGMMYILGITAALLFTVGAIFLPRTLINFYAHEASVIDYGAGYLSIVGISYVPTVIGFALSVVCRSTGNMKLPTFTSVLSMMINIVGNAILIFGLLGAPALGVNGAAIATVIARTVECAVLVFFIYRHKMAGAATFRELFCFDRMFVRRYVKTTAPVLINETLWSIGTSLYSVAFGLLGTNAVAAVQIANTIAQMLLVFVRGAGNAAAIMIGNKIGAGKEEEAFADSKRFMILMLVIGSVVCVAVILLRPLILSIYNVSDETLQFANELLLLSRSDHHTGLYQHAGHCRCLPKRRRHQVCLSPRHALRLAARHAARIFRRLSRLSALGGFPLCQHRKNRQTDSRNSARLFEKVDQQRRLGPIGESE